MFKEGLKVISACCLIFVLILFWFFGQSWLLFIYLFINLISISATRSLHKASSDTHAPSKIAAWAYLRSLIVQSFIVFALIHQTLTCRIVHEQAELAERTCEWYLSSVRWSLDSARPLLSHDDSDDHEPQQSRKRGVNAARCEAKICSGTYKLACINHTSVASRMHTNLCVLDLCGSSNLTKIYTNLSTRSQAMINENYLRRSK